MLKTFSSEKMMDSLLSALKMLKTSPIVTMQVWTTHTIALTSLIIDVEEEIRRKDRELNEWVAAKTVQLAAADSPLKDANIKLTKANIESYIDALPETRQLKLDIDELKDRKALLDRHDRLLYEISGFIKTYTGRPQELQDEEEVDDDQLDEIRQYYSSKY